MPEIEIIQFPGKRKGTSFSPPCWKVQLACLAKGLEVKEVNVRTPMEIKRVNPRGRVPACRIDGEIIVDSSDILDALDARFPEPSLQPESPADRALVRILEDWADDVIYFHLVYLRWLVPANRARLKEILFKKQLPGVLASVASMFGAREVRKRARGQGIGLKDEATVRREFEGAIKALEDMLRDGRDWLVGGQLTRADLAIYAVVDQARDPVLSPEVAAMVGRYEKVGGWLDRIAARTATFLDPKPGEGAPASAS